MSLVYEEMQVEWNGEMARIAKKDFNPEIHKPWVEPKVESDKERADREAKEAEEFILAESARLAKEAEDAAKTKGKHK